MGIKQTVKDRCINEDATKNTIFSKLDEAIDDMENGRVITEEELWAELDSI